MWLLNQKQLEAKGVELPSLIKKQEWKLSDTP